MSGKKGRIANVRKKEEGNLMRQPWGLRHPLVYFNLVIPAKAGIQTKKVAVLRLAPRLRGGDGVAGVTKKKNGRLMPPASFSTAV